MTKIQAGYTNEKDYKKGNINFLTVKVQNIGSLSTKATRVTIFYQDPKKLGKVNAKYKKFTASAKLKALKPGKSATLQIQFKIPKKMQKLIKNVRLDSANKNKNQINKASNIYRF